MIHVRARACNDDGCLCLTARTRKRGSTHIGQWQPRARARHGLSRFAQPMHDCQHAQPLNWTARAQDAHDGLRGRHAGLRRRHEVDIGFLRAGGWIEGLSLLSYMRGSSAAIRLVHLFMNANRMLAAVYAHTSASEHSHGNSDSS